MINNDKEPKLGEILHIQRIALDLSLGQLANEIKVSPSYLSRI
jgi:cytoskeletal protein RodZ